MRKKVLPAYIATIVCLAIIMLAMNAIQPSLANNAYIPGFLDMLLGGGESFFYRFLWFFADPTEAYFFKAPLAAVGVFCFALLADMLERKGKPFMGMRALNGSGMFWPVLTVATLSLIISNLLYYVPGAWAPTFTPFVSSAPSIVLVFGRDWKKIITSAILAGVVTFPVCNFLMVSLAPLGIPGFCGPAIGMGISTILLIEVCRLLPWMKAPDTQGPVKGYEKTPSAPIPMEGNRLFFTRMLADGGEPIFWGSPLSTIGLYLGAILSWVLNPTSIQYASGRLPIFIFGTLFTTATAIFIWYPKYVKEGFVFTFVCAVTTGSVLNTYDVPMITIVLTALVSATLMPAIVHFLLEKVKVTHRWHPCPLALTSLGIVSAIWSLIIMNIPGLIN